jgi:2,4-dienoyl-CoA reductase-like NADH-dependent reductase (Old Yellow Enzyme family)
MSLLFSPLSLGTLALENRIIIAPMCQYSAEDGSATDWHTIHLGGLALSGAGLLILEATAVSPEARITSGDLGLYCDANEAALAGVIAAIRHHSAIPIAIQLGHAGRKASSRFPWEGGSQILPTEPNGWQTLAPSPIPHNPTEHAPDALDDAGLAKIIGDFVATAKRAVNLGIQGIELHAAHGYLLHQFLSPLSNHRSDSYGGSLENRLRFPLELFDHVRAALPKNYPLWVRLSATDWAEGGWDLESSIAFSQALESRGAAAIHVSSGGLSFEQKIPLDPGYQVPFAAAIKAAVKIPVIAVGLITEPAQAETILTQNQADAIAIARAILYQPHWPWQAAAELGAQVDAPKQYWRSQPRQYKTLFHAASHGQR